MASELVNLWLDNWRPPGYNTDMATVYAQTLERISENVPLRHEDVARIVGASVRSVSRWARGETGPRGKARERLLELSAVVKQLSKVLTPDAAEAWLFTPNPALDFERPVELLHSGDYKRVLAAIEGLEDGVFV